MRPMLLILGLLANFAVAYDCSVTAITALLPAKSIVFYATHYDAGATFTPRPEYNAGGGLPSDGPGGPPGGLQGRGGSIIPQAGCIVQGNVSLSATSQYSFGLALPDNCNGRFLTVGNGGFFGSVSWDSVIDGMWYGFASISTDTGHESGGADWAYNHPEALENWGYCAMYDTVLRGKAVTQGYYGTNISYSYYRGCSAGGKQGLKEVEMFPNDFDGVVAGAPAWWTNHLQLWNMILGIWNQPGNSSHHIPPSMTTYFADEFIRQCDAQDGVTDGIVMDPLACKFNATKLLCPAGATDPTTCLNSDQIAIFNKLHNDWVGAGQFIFPSFTLGTDNFNLAPFHKKGGKLLHYHGLPDASIATGSSIYFYNQVAKALKLQGNKLYNFYKFYLIPGIGHCAMTYPKMNAPWVIGGDGQAVGLTRTSYGVPGFQDAKHDVLLAVMAWVESGTVPTDIIATKYANDTNPDGGVLRQRLLCAYPSKAVYDGTGEVNGPENWSCKAA
ncbi:hypothetical protein EAF00_008530 [Botryotinia globosa]|nr:hypothetical protein EAF00_008530 [Botryotinia globosa]